MTRRRRSGALIPLILVLGVRAMEYSEWWASRADSPGRNPGTAPQTPPGAEGTAGGLRCTWLSVDEPGPFMTLFVLPAQVAEPSTVQALSETTCEWDYDTRLCRLGATGNGVWALASMMVAEDAEPPTRPLTRAVEAALANAADFAPGVPAVVEVGRWDIVDCDELGRRMDVSEVLGADYWSGYWEGTRQREDDLYQHAGVQQFCQYGTGDEGAEDGHRILSVMLQPGAAWRWPQEVAAQGGETAIIAGATDARRWLISEESPTTDHVAATDGVNSVRITVQRGEDAPDIAARVFAAFD